MSRRLSDPASPSTRASRRSNDVRPVAMMTTDDSLETQLKQIEESYRQLFEHTHDPLVLSDLRGALLAINPAAARLMGLLPADVLGKTLDGDGAPAGLRSLLALLPAARENAQALHVLDARWGGQNLKLTCHTQHVRLGQGIAIQWLIQDHAHDPVLQEDQTYMIVHDLRNPLSNVISSLELIEEVMHHPDKRYSLDSLVTIALRSSRRIQLLVESLLDLKRMESGGFNLMTTTARLDVLLERAVDFVQPSAERKNIPLSMQLDPDLPPVLIDVNMIERVVVNLLDNACKFVENEQAVIVSARRVASKWVEIAVRDEGPGIAPEDLVSLFQKFKRGSNAGKTPGSGLGLVFCKFAVEAHGGRITVDSQPGRGSTFAFVLPAE